MEFIRKLNYKNKDIFYIKLNSKFEEEYINLVECYCDYQDLERLNNYIFKKDKQRHLSSIILQKFVIKKYTGIKDDYKKIKLLRTSSCKPYFVFDNKIIEYNVSHDKDIIIIIYSEKYQVGIDIMSFEQEERVNNISIKFYKTEEENINKLKLWTLIESYYKSMGKSISNIDNRNFYFNESDNEIIIYKNNILLKNFNFHTFYIDNYIISITEIIK